MTSRRLERTDRALLRQAKSSGSYQVTIVPAGGHQYLPAAPVGISRERHTKVVSCAQSQTGAIGKHAANLDG